MSELTFSLFGLLLVVSAAFGLVNWAMRANKGDKAAIMGLYLLFGMPGILLFVAGLALVVNGTEGGWFAIGLGLGFSLPLLKPLRQLLARVTPIDPDSPIDYSGLAILLSVSAFLFFSLVLSDEPVEIQATEASDIVPSLIINLMAFLALAYIAVGYRNYRNGEEATARLGLWKPTQQEVIVGLVAVIPAFILSMIGSVLTGVLQPEVVDRLGENIDNLTAGVQNPLGALLLGLSAGIGEEVLFRGALQPRFGIFLTTLLWVLLHTQYELTWVMLGLALMGILLGYIRNRYGTVAAIITHATYNALVVLLQMAI
ncbi:MAG TPA: CPBP family intramembrane glutamic endopeptidase [Thermomicrobiales bacterium]|jgi:membrane protease YdiL (CAAX protease family)|nr:CPBP family intramembrane glutamic endopeptidase [Thermomicrobiales bacterium]